LGLRGEVQAFLIRPNGPAVQERYLGDSHDFIKYALPRHLHREIGLRIGVNWYLTRPEEVDSPHNKDGEKRQHLKDKDWQGWDTELLNSLRRFEDPTMRQIRRVSDWRILPHDTLYFDELVPVDVDGRQAWQRRAQSALGDADLVFLDPDTGFQVKSMKMGKAPKYSLYTEAMDWFRAGKTVIGIQFARQCDPVKRGKEVREKLHSEDDAVSKLPIVRGRVAPNILLITLSPKDNSKTLKATIKSFVESRTKVELIL
jgi:hypothetical protein